MTVILLRDEQNQIIGASASAHHRALHVIFRRRPCTGWDGSASTISRRNSSGHSGRTSRVGHKHGEL
jgi:hypothetical protein